MAGTTTAAFDGIFSVNKAVGMTSHDVVARVRRLAHQKRVGHAGTLDPAADGVLPICLGQATRIVEYLSESGKAYRAIVRFGVVTDTYDREGRVMREAPVTLTHAEIAAVLPEFLGAQMQTPPIYSALKRDGQPLYALARAGKDVTVEPRRIRIDELRLVAWNPPDLTLDVACGKGTYIRSLAYDLGERLGPGAHLAALTRTRSGPFTLDDSLTLEQLEAALADNTWRTHFYAPDEALLGWRAVILAAESERRLRTGQLLHFADLTPGPFPCREGEAESAHSAIFSGPSSLIRAYSVDGRFLGILRWDGERQAWQPHKVLDVAPEPEVE